MPARHNSFPKVSINPFMRVESLTTVFVDLKSIFELPLSHRMLDRIRGGICWVPIIGKGKNTKSLEHWCGREGCLRGGETRKEL
jgi:hypothetical protein